MLDREGVEGSADLALIGNESFVREKIHELAEAGVTDFAATEFTPGNADQLRTRALLKSMIEA